MKKLLHMAVLMGSIGISGQAAGTIYGEAISPNESLWQRDGNDRGTIVGGDGFTGRVQQVYDASFFRFLPPEGGWIDAISFRGDKFGALSTSYTGTGIQIQLTTTTAQVDGLNSVFTENLGQDTKVVISRDTIVSFSNGREAGNGPNSFATGFGFFATPFFYNPMKGNLLIDVSYFQDISASLYDAENVAGDSVSTLSAFAFGTGEIPVKGNASSKGFVTGFTYHPVPEPSSLALLGAGAVTLEILRRRRLITPNQPNVPS